MKTSISFVLAIAASLLSQAIGAPVAESLAKRTSGSCDTTGLTASAVVGSGGTPFCESGLGTSDQPIQSLMFWDTAELVVGFQATYADGTQGPVIGRQNNRNPQTITVDYSQGQLFHAAQLFAHPNGQFTRHVRMVSSTGAIMNAGEALPEVNGNEIQREQVGDGKLMAVQGTTSENGLLESMGLIFA